MCSCEIDKQDGGSINSDVTIFEHDTFNNILDMVKKSHLNFQLQLSPYSAVISLKKTVLRDKSGKPMLPAVPLHQKASNTIESLIKKNENLENKLLHMETIYEDIVRKYNSACYSLSALDSLKKENAALTEDVIVKNETLCEFEKKVKVL